jgi:SAM-dependent methyltransferase
MAVRDLIQKVLKVGGYRLFQLPKQPTSGFEAFDRRVTIRGEERSSAPEDSDLERWFRSGNAVGVFKWQHYFDVYDRHFRHLRGRSSVKVLEIGVFKGGSLRMWKEYFGPGTTVVGLDIDETCRRFENAPNRIHVRIGDQESVTFLAAVNREFGPFDVIIDDGGHTTAQQIQSFTNLYLAGLTEEGIYLVEDLHTNYWPEYLTHPDNLTFVDLAGRLAHKLHDPYFGRCDDFERFDIKHPQRIETIEVSAFCAVTRSIHFYDSIVVFERARKTIPYTEMR